MVACSPSFITPFPMLQIRAALLPFCALCLPPKADVSSIAIAPTLNADDCQKESSESICQYDRSANGR